MRRIALEELGFGSRTEALAFLKRLWRMREASCPICGNGLEPLHPGVKRRDDDWQCRQCGGIYRTMRLFCELNERMPD